jgi:microcystin-dependent protein
VSDQFVGEIRMVGFNFAPIGWALCNGQLLPISQNTALFSLLGTQFGGDGVSNFALPNLQGCVPIDQGTGVGLTPRSVGDIGGEASVTLLQSTLPAHTHAIGCDTSVAANQASPVNGMWAAPPAPRRGTAPQTYSTAAPNASMSPNALAGAGGSLPHNNLQPYLTLNFIIAMQGIFPPRS